MPLIKRQKRQMKNFDMISKVTTGREYNDDVNFVNQRDTTNKLHTVTDVKVRKRANSWMCLNFIYRGSISSGASLFSHILEEMTHIIQTTHKG
jgi:hypothetical protein